MSLPASGPEFVIRLGTVDREFELFRDDRVAISSPHGVRITDALVLEALPEGRTGEWLVAGGREGTVAEVLARLNPGARVTDFYDDVFHAERATERLREVFTDVEPPRVIADADLPEPEGGFDGIFLLLSHHGDSRLATELIQEAQYRLKDRGTLAVAVDSVKDSFVRERVKRVFGAASLRVDRRGQIVSARRQKVRPRKPPFRETFTFKEGEAILEFVSRPGVFAAGRLDDGARALIATMEVNDGDHVLDLGCGVGPVGIAAGRRRVLGSLVLADAHVRSLRLAEENCHANLEGVPFPVRCVLTAHPDRDLAAERFDVVVANPPYYSDYKIAELFLDTGLALLRPGGRFHVVTKQVEWHDEAFRRRGVDVTTSRRGGYTVYTVRA